MTINILKEAIRLGGQSSLKLNREGSVEKSTEIKQFSSYQQMLDLKKEDYFKRNIDYIIENNERIIRKK